MSSATTRPSLVRLLGSLLLLCVSSACDVGLANDDPVATAVQQRRRPLAAARPRFWAWQEPLGRAKGRSDVIQIVRENTARGSAEEVADRVCDQIRNRRLRSGQIAIVLQNFGMGGGNPEKSDARDAPALFRHWCDGLEHRRTDQPTQGCEQLGPRDVVTEWWMTPWMKHGIDESGVWMKTFTRRYLMRQALDHALPNPTRFHFDTEGLVVPHRTIRGSVEAFHAMRDDVRWGTEPIPGHAGETIGALYEAAGAPTVDPKQSWLNGENRAWATWYAGVCYQAADAAMNEAAYRHVRGAWSGCKSSNYATSARSDGAGDPARVLTTAGGTTWFKYAHEAWGDLQAPVLYWVHPRHQRDGESMEDAAVRVARGNTDALIHSFDGPHRNITPWVEVNGTRRVRWKRTLDVPTSMLRDLLAMLRARQVTEFLMWSDKTTQEGPGDWNAFADVIDDVWSTSLVSYSVETGKGSGRDAPLLQWASRDMLPVAAVADDDGVYRVRMRARFQRSRRRPHAAGLTVVAEGRIDGADGTVTAALRDWTSGGDRVIGPSSFDDGVAKWRTPDASSTVDDAGLIEVSIEATASAPFTLSLDTVQVYPSDPRREPRTIPPVRDERSP